MNLTPDIETAPVATRGLGAAAVHEAASLTEGLAGTVKSVLNNPALPSEFDLSAATSGRKRKWELANSNPAPFGKAWRGFQTFHPIKAL